MASEWGMTQATMQAAIKTPVIMVVREAETPANTARWVSAMAIKQVAHIQLEIPRQCTKYCNFKIEVKPYS